MHKSIDRFNLQEKLFMRESSIEMNGCVGSLKFWYLLTGFAKLAALLPLTLQQIKGRTQDFS